MITEKEKLVVKIIYTEYKKNKDPYKLYMLTSELIDKSCGKLTVPDLQALILHGKSKYINFLDSIGEKVQLNPIGISYMEDRLKNIVQIIGFWIFGVPFFIAAIYGILAYYK